MWGLTLLLGAGAPALAESDLRLGISRGIDSNPLERPSDGLRGAFTQVDLDAAFSRDPTDRVGFFVDCLGTIRRFEDSSSDGDFGWADARAGLTITPWRRGHRRFALAAGGTAALYRSTYIDPATGETFLAGAGPATFVPIPNRFDHDSLGLFLNLRWRADRAVLLFLDTSVERRSYVEDYSGDTRLEPLDDRSLTVEPGARLLIGRRALVDLSLEWTDREYDELSSLNENGVPVPGAPRSFRYAGYRIALRVDPTPRWELRFGILETDRRDVHAGYYDSRGSDAVLSAAYRAGEWTRFRVLATRRNLSYDNAPADPSDPDGAGRRTGTTRILGLGERDLGERVTVFVEAGTLSSDSRDPLYAYEREWVRLGVRLKL